MTGKPIRARTAPSTKDKAPPRVKLKKPLAIDVHNHIRIPAVEEFVRNNPVKGSGPGKQPWVSKESSAFQQSHAKEMRPKFVDPKVRLRDMDRMGIDIQVISMNLPQTCYWADGRKGLEVARACNDGIAEFVKADPDRFVGVGSVPLQNVSLSVKELERAVNDLGLKGVVTASNIRNAELGDPKFKAFWARAEQLQIPVFIHPQGFSHPERLQKHFLWNSIGQPLEEALAMASLIYDGVMNSFPKLKVCIDHGGGFFPFYSGRVDRAFKARPEARKNIDRPPSAYMRRFYYDTVFYDRDMLHFLIKKVGVNQVMMGTDYPLSMTERDPCALIRRSRALSSEVKEKVLWKNAAKFLNIRL